MTVPLSREKIRFIKAVTILLTVLQTAAVIGGYVLDDLSHKKAGVNHHVVFRKRQYLQTILREDRIILYLLLAAVILILIAVYLFRHPGWHLARILGPLAMITITLGLALTSSVFKAMPAYVYLLGIGLLVWGIEFVKVLLKVQVVKRS